MEDEMDERRNVLKVASFEEREWIDAGLRAKIPCPVSCALARGSGQIR